MAIVAIVAIVAIPGIRTDPRPTVDTETGPCGCGTIKPGPSLHAGGTSTVQSSSTATTLNWDPLRPKAWSVRRRQEGLLPRPLLLLAAAPHWDPVPPKPGLSRRHLFLKGLAKNGGYTKDPRASSVPNGLAKNGGLTKDPRASSTLKGPAKNGDYTKDLGSSNNAGSSNHSKDLGLSNNAGTVKPGLCSTVGTTRPGPAACDSCPTKYGKRATAVETTAGRFVSAELSCTRPPYGSLHHLGPSARDFATDASTAPHGSDFTTSTIPGRPDRSLRIGNANHTPTSDCGAFLTLGYDGKHATSLQDGTTATPPNQPGPGRKGGEGEIEKYQHAALHANTWPGGPAVNSSPDGHLVPALQLWATSPGDTGQNTPQ